MLNYPFTYYLSHSISYLFSQPAILFWILFEHLYLKAKHWQKACTMLMVLMPWNTILKALIAVPLMPPMVGYAIPSGHTHAVLGLWGYIAYKYRGTKIGNIIMFLLLVFFWSLVHRHYHQWLDVFVALLCFLVELFLFERYFSKREYFGLISIVVMLFVLYFMGITKLPKVSILMLSGLVLGKGYKIFPWLGLVFIWLYVFGQINLAWSDIVIPIVLIFAVRISDLKIGG